MFDILMSFPLERSGLSKREDGYVIFSVPGWTLTVGDVRDAQRNRNPELERLCVELGIASNGDGPLLRERIKHHVLYLKNRGMR